MRDLVKHSVDVNELYERFKISPKQMVRYNMFKNRESQHHKNKFSPKINL